MPTIAERKELIEKIKRSLTDNTYPVFCVVCGEDFADWVQQDAHALASSHYACTTCLMHFPSRSALDIHAEVHTKKSTSGFLNYILDLLPVFAGVETALENQRIKSLCTIDPVFAQTVLSLIFENYGPCVGDEVVSALLDILLADAMLSMKQHGETRENPTKEDHPFYKLLSPTTSCNSYFEKLHFECSRLYTSDFAKDKKKDFKFCNKASFRDRPIPLVSLWKEKENAPKATTQEPNKEKAEECKAKGNTAFNANQFDLAIECYTLAIANDPQNHVLYSNRAAAYIEKKMWLEASKDAQVSTEINPTWCKGYLREALALQNMNKIAQALCVTMRGLSEIPDNKDLKAKLEELKDVASPPNKNNNHAKARFLDSDSSESNDGSDDENDYESDSSDEPAYDNEKKQQKGSSALDGLQRLLSISSGGPWSEGLSEKAAYQRFVNSYRLRVEDDYVWGGGNVHGLYAQEDPVVDFKKYLTKAKKKGVMPAWWNDSHEKKMLHMAVTDDWVNLKFAVEKSDIIEKYGHGEHFALRALAEVVYGSSARGF